MCQSLDIIFAFSDSRVTWVFVSPACRSPVSAPVSSRALVLDADEYLDGEVVRRGGLPAPARARLRHAPRRHLLHAGNITIHFKRYYYKCESLIVCYLSTLQPLNRFGGNLVWRLWDMGKEIDYFLYLKIYRFGNKRVQLKLNLLRYRGLWYYK